MNFVVCKLDQIKGFKGNLKIETLELQCLSNLKGHIAARWKTGVRTLGSPKPPFFVFPRAGYLPKCLYYILNQNST